MSYLDLSWELQTNSDFSRKIQDGIMRIAEAEKRSKRSELCLALVELLRLCEYNAGLLVPFFFPQYPEEKPLSLFDRPYSFAMFNFQIGGFTVIRASRQIGKSTTIGAREKMLCDLLPGYRSLYIAPHRENVDTYANRLKEMDRAFRYPTLGAKFRQNLGYKEFPNGSVMELIRILSNANDARGKTTDTLVFDEYQHFDDSLMLEVQMCQKASSMPQTIFTGTSLTVDTALEARWLQSSQGTWHIICECSKEIDCGVKEDIIPCIQPLGMTCPRCSRILDVTKGHFVHAYQELADAGWVGLHVPQIIIPHFTNNLRKWSEIYEDFVNYELDKFLQEVLGIATLEGAREITVDDLKRMCCLPESRETLQKRAKDGYYKWVISGCDWGGSDYIPQFQQKVSTTVHVMLGVRFDGDIDIVHMQRYGGMGYREIADAIVVDHVKYGGGPIATDFGVGAAYNMLLRENPNIVADRHLIFSYVGPRSALLAPPATEGWYNQYSLNRTESITSLFEAVKRTRKYEVTENGEKVVKTIHNPRIRCYAWEDANKTLVDFLNLVRAPTESNLGVGSFKYRRHGSKPDDTLHAVNFAYALARVLLGEPIVEDRGLKARLEDLFRIRSLPVMGGRGAGAIRPIAG